MTSFDRLIRLALAVTLIVAGSGTAALSESGSAARPTVLVFAAASTTNAVTDIGELYAARRVGCITPSFASSSTLAKQIENGAPADVFISANEKWMTYLEEKELLITESQFNLLSNRLVLIVPNNRKLQRIEVAPGFPLADALGKTGRFSIGDPDHVPAGIYGKQALQKLRIWETVKDRIAPMKDVRAALVLVERGEVPLGLVYATDAAISTKVRVVGMLPADSHPPIVYSAAATAGGNVDAAQSFLEFLQTPEAGVVFKKYGFDVR